MSDDTEYSKLFGCNVHKTIRLSPMALKIINTPEFQRMRDINQLGLCYQVYPAANHSRFEHSLGVYHLTDKMVSKIQHQYPNKDYIIPELTNPLTKLTSKIAECIKLAGLLHDIGHGPFSHIFDDIFLRGVDHPNANHEVRSCLITEILCRRELKNELDDGHIKFIQSVINPSDSHKGALYQIVANKLNGIDVDKFDYLKRDAINLGLQLDFDEYRLINEFIIDTNGNIAYPKHSTTDIYSMYHSRYMMHKKVYSHKTVKLLEVMLEDLFEKINPIFKMSESIRDMKEFCKYTNDTIFSYIKLIVDPPPYIQNSLTPDQLRRVSEAFRIHNNISNRKLYQVVYESVNESGSKVLLEGFLTWIETEHGIPKSNFKIVETTIGFIGSGENPFSNIYIYDKKENNESHIIDKNYFSGLINDIRETHAYLICRKRSISKRVINLLNQYKSQH